MGENMILIVLAGGAYLLLTCALIALCQDNYKLEKKLKNEMEYSKTNLNKYVNLIDSIYYLNVFKGISKDKLYDYIWYKVQKDKIESGK